MQIIPDSLVSNCDQSLWKPYAYSCQNKVTFGYEKILLKRKKYVTMLSSGIKIPVENM